MATRTHDDPSGISRPSWRRALRVQLDRLRRGSRASAASSMRITIAAVASYVVATLIFPGSVPLLAPLTAMLVVQVTPVSLLASGVERVVAVVTGVALAVAFASVTPLEWWSLGILIFVSVVIGHLLHLGANLLEVPISAMLVLGVGTFSAESAAWDRIAETLVGAAVGVLGNLLFPPKVASGTAAESIDDLASQISGLLDQAAGELAAAVTERQDLDVVARPWLDRARRITEENLALSASALAHAEQGRRLNVRALGTPDVGPGLRQGLEALEHSALAVRSMFRTVVDVSSGTPGIDVEESEDVLLGLAQTFRELAGGIAAFGALVRNEAGTAKRLGAADIRALVEALEGMSEARARLDDLLMTADTPALAELQAVVATTIRRLSAEMDLNQRVRRQIQLGQESRARPAYLGRPVEKPPRTSAEEVIAEAKTLPLSLPRPGRGDRQP